MVRYVPGQFGRFFRRQDWNTLAQEITTALIGIGLGLYCYEKRVAIIPGTESFLSKLPGSQILTTEDQPFLTAGLIMMVVAGFIKIILYLGVIDLNRMKGKSSRRRGINLSGILQDALTIVLGITIGLFTTPIAKDLVLVEKVEYPNPWLGIGLTATCLFAKFILYADVINFRRGLRFFQPHKIKTTLAKLDWNAWLQETTATCIGIGIGFYMYQSGITTAFGDFGDKVLGKAENRATSLWDKVASPITGKKFNELGINSIWEDDQGKVYVIVGLWLIGVSALIKFLIYTSIWDANHTRDFLVGHGGGHSKPFGIDFAGIMDEIATLLLTVAIGILTAPITKNAFLENQDPQTMGVIIPVAVFVLALFKFALYAGALQFGSRRA